MLLTVVACQINLSFGYHWVHVLLWYLTAVQRSLECGYEKDYLLVSLKIVIILDFLRSHAMHKYVRCLSLAVEFELLRCVPACVCKFVACTLVCMATHNPMSNLMSH